MATLGLLQILHSKGILMTTSLIDLENVNSESGLVVPEWCPEVFFSTGCVFGWRLVALL